MEESPYCSLERRNEREVNKRDELRRATNILPYDMHEAYTRTRFQVIGADLHVAECFAFHHTPAFAPSANHSARECKSAALGQSQPRFRRHLEARLIDRY